MATLVFVLVEYIRVVGVQPIGLTDKILAPIRCLELFKPSLTRFVRLGFYGKARVVLLVDYVEFAG